MNMSYCKFRNTLSALEDCAETLEALHYGEDANGDEVEELSPEEDRARERLVELMADTLRTLGYEVSGEV